MRRVLNQNASRVRAFSNVSYTPPLINTSRWRLDKPMNHHSPDMLQRFREARKNFHIETSLQNYNTATRENVLDIWDRCYNEDGTPNTCKFKAIIMATHLQEMCGRSEFTMEDLRKFLKSQGVKMNTIYLQDMFSEFDENENGVIEFEEVVKIMSSFNLDMEVRQVLEKLATNIRQKYLEDRIKRLLKEEKPRQLQESRLPHERMSHKILQSSKCAIVQAGISGGQEIVGCDKTPMMMRWETPLVDDAIALGWQIEDYAIDFDLIWQETKTKYSDPENVNMNDCHKIGVQSEELAMLNYSLASNDKFIVNIGGDHSMAFGTIGGILKARPNLGIVWVDAHADLNSPETSPSGNLHGMPMSAILQVTDYTKFKGWEWMDVCLNSGSVVFIGLRDLDPLEKKLIRALNIHVFDRNDVSKYGIGKIMHLTSEILNLNGTRPIHLSFDIDGIDGRFAPSTGTVAAGGLTDDESIYIATHLANSGCLCSMDMAEINTEILLGAPAGYASEVITKTKAAETEMSEFSMHQLNRNPQKTLDLGKRIILAALGQTYV